MEVVSVPTVPQRERSRLRFGLKSIFFALTLLSIASASYFYYRDASVTVRLLGGLIRKAEIGRIIASHTVHSIPGSSYSWVEIPSPQLESLVMSSQPAIDVLLDRRWIVRMWPLQAFTDTNVRSLPIGTLLTGAPPPIIYLSGGFNGFLGARRAGARVQFRIDGVASYKTDVFHDNPSLLYHNGEVRGKLEFEGDLPAGALVFYAPLDDNWYDVVIFAPTTDGRGSSTSVSRLP
jgi:hypothetical protein